MPKGQPELKGVSVLVEIIPAVVPAPTAPPPAFQECSMFSFRATVVPAPVYKVSPSSVALQTFETLQFILLST